MKHRQLGVLLACFDGKKSANRARRRLTRHLRAQGDDVLDVGIVEVDDNHKGATYDPHRMVWGTVSVVIVYALCGFAGAYGAWSVIFWAAVGGVGGWLCLYFYVRHLTGSELSRITGKLPAQSSAYLIWVATDDVGRVLETTAGEKPTVANIAAIDADLTTRVFGDAADPVGVPPDPSNLRDVDTTLLSLVVIRYAQPEAATQMALHPPQGSPFEVAMMIRNDADGRRRVSDPYLGVKATGLSTMLWWGGFGLGIGALSGYLGGGGLFDAVDDGVSTAILWGLFGLCVGAIYGLVIGRAFARRRLRRVASLMAPGTSILMAWVDAASPFTADTLDEYAKPGSERLILNFNSVERGAVLAVG